MATPGIAANAYARLATITNPSNALARTVGDGNEAQSGPNFGQVLKDVVNSVVESGRKTDLQTQAAAAGKANLVDVVTAVSETEVAIQTLVSVRDKVIQSYEEIMRMPI
jgi:flagellar hook-basal body complex protein FliE